MAEKKPLTGMPCEEFTQLASSGLEKPVGFRNRLRMLWHQIECVYCRRFVRQLKRIHGLLAQPEPEKPMPGEMRTKLHKHLGDP